MEAKSGMAAEAVDYIDRPLDLTEEQIEKRVKRARLYARVVIWIMRVCILMAGPLYLVMAAVLWLKTRQTGMEYNLAWFNSAKVQRGLAMTERHARLKFWWED